MIIPVILGPTCIGKTSLALEIAMQEDADILSIDSRQVFKDLDIGTGKYKGDSQFSKNEGFWEIDGVKIWGYDLLKPNEELNVLEYCNFAKKIITDYQKKGKNLIATCGTGFYLDFLSGNIEYNEVNEVRKKELHKKSLEELLEILEKHKDLENIDLKNKLRIITKILSIESPPTKNKFLIPDVVFKIFYLEEKREFIYSNADKFANEIIQNNVVLEYQENFKKYGECRALEGLIYKDIKEYLARRILLDELRSKIKFSLHAYIRRQQTYFKKMNIEFSSNNRKDIIEKIKNLF